MSGMIQIKVILFGPAADVVGESELEYGLAPPARLSDLFDLLSARYPTLAGRISSLRFAVNEEYADMDTPLRQNDEVAVIPPVSGG